RILEVLCKTFRIKICIPGHRRDIEWVRHFSCSYVEPTERFPAQIDLTNVDVEGRFAERSLIRRAAGRRAEGDPGRSWIVRRVEANAVVEIVKDFATKTETDGNPFPVQLDSAIPGIVDLPIFVTQPQIAEQFDAFEGVVDLPLGFH